MLNYSEDLLNKFLKRFPKVEFIRENRELEKKPGFKECFKCTYLKGEFLERSFTGRPILWIDCTALIRSNPQELLDLLADKKTILMRRDFNREYGKAVFACEIFGMNDLEEIKSYRANCEKNKEEWFADQLALCEVKNKSYFDFGTWSNFYYNELAKSWSDRGRNGTGINSKEDEDYTLNKYLSYLEQGFPNVRKEFRDYRPFGKNILVHVDSEGWCYKSTILRVTELLKDKFNFEIIWDADSQKDAITNFEGELVWARCGAYRHKKLTDISPRLEKISFSSITTGGELLFDRINKNLAFNMKHAGIIVQNEEAKEFVESAIEGKRNQKVYVLPNGCDIEKFKPVKKDKFIIGFNGRKNGEMPNLKGYNYFKQAVKNLGFETLELTGENCLNYEEMPSFYNLISLLVLPSNSEGCSNTINEALSSGVPVLAVKTGYHAEACGENSGIVWISRNVKDIREAILFARDNLERLSKEARAWAEEHSWEKIIPIYEDTFNKMIIDAQENVPSNEVLGIIKVVARRDVNIGQIDKSGINYFLKKGESVEMPYNNETKHIVDTYLRGKFIEMLNI
jgi:glycosyltransferase involved in cell wall biosynthesis